MSRQHIRTMPDDERVVEELEALEAILMDEIIIKKDEKGVNIETVVHPATGSERELQYVRVTLEVRLPPGYPDISPTVRLANPRGLDEQLVSILEKQVADKCRDNIGQPVIFELIEVVKEHLTECNLPCCPCCICLYGFRETDHFVKTQCYHYFHSRCLAGHLTASEKIFKEEQDKLPPWQQTQHFQPVCPICRASIDYDVGKLSRAPPPQDLEEAPKTFEPSSELRLLQQRMASLYLRQRNKGGIILHQDNTLLLTTDEGAESTGNSR